jgi:hypothetical protein
MIAHNCTQHDLEVALALVNTYYADNIRFKSLDPNSRGFRFTLTVRQTSIGTGKHKVGAPGVRHSSNSSRRIAAACWLIQFNGLAACSSCEALNTDDCGGQDIRKKLVNEKGIAVPLGKAVPA